MSAVGPLALRSTSHVKDVCCSCSRGTPAYPPQMCDDAAARVWIKRHATEVSRSDARSRRCSSIFRMVGRVVVKGGLCHVVRTTGCVRARQSAAPPHFATPTRYFSLLRRSKPPPSPRSAAFMAGGARSLARCLLALAASGGGSVVVCRLKANH